MPFTACGMCISHVRIMCLVHTVRPPLGLHVVSLSENRDHGVVISTVEPLLMDTRIADTHYIMDTSQSPERLTMDSNTSE